MRRATALADPDRRFSWSMSSHFYAIHSLCVPHSQKSPKNTKTAYFGNSRSSMLTSLKSSSLVLVIISSMSICKRFHAAQANNSKITTQANNSKITTS